MTTCVVIPHLSNRAGLAKAVQSVGDYPCFVVDGSKGGAPRVTEKESLVDLWGSKVSLPKGSSGNSFAISANIGLSAAHLAGYSRALLLNDDAILEPGALLELERVFTSADDVGAVGPLLYCKSGLESAGLCFSSRTARAVQRGDIPKQVEERVALSGACLLISTTERFDESFDHGFEDYELCIRIAKQGKRILIAPDARAFHEGGGTVSRRSRRAVAGALSGHLKLVRGRPLMQALVVSYAALQLLREGGGADALMGFCDGITEQ